MNKDFKTDDRGFAIYGELTDINNSIITVVESSLAKEHCIRLFTDSIEYGPGLSPHLTKTNILKLINILQYAVKHIDHCDKL